MWKDVGYVRAVEREAVIGTVSIKVVFKKPRERELVIAETPSYTDYPST